MAENLGRSGRPSPSFVGRVPSDHMEFPIRVVLQAAVCGDSRPNGDSNVRGAWSQLSKRSRAVFFLTIQMFVEFFSVSALATFAKGGVN